MRATTTTSATTTPVTTPASTSVIQCTPRTSLDNDAITAVTTTAGTSHRGVRGPTDARGHDHDAHGQRSSGRCVRGRKREAGVDHGSQRGVGPRPDDTDLHEVVEHPCDDDGGERHPDNDPPAHFAEEPDSGENRTDKHPDRPGHDADRLRGPDQRDVSVRGEPPGDVEVQMRRVSRAVGRGELDPGKPQEDTKDHERERRERDPQHPAHGRGSPVNDRDVDDWVDRVHHIGHVRNVGSSV